MAKPGKDWGPLHPKVETAETTEKLAKTELPRERQLELVTRPMQNAAR